MNRIPLQSVKRIVAIIYTGYHNGSFEFFQVRKLDRTYERGFHTRLSREGYLILDRMDGKVRKWRLSYRSLKLIGRTVNGAKRVSENTG